MTSTSSKIVILALAFLCAPLGWADDEQDYDRALQATKTGDYKTAFPIFKRLPEQGNADTQLILSFMYHEGQGVPQDHKEAAKWSRKTAEQGHAGAQHNLGLMYAKGQGVPQDYKEAVKWYRKAAEQGVASAQGKLGTMYGNGQGVPQDYVQAHMWFNLAASQGDEIATKNRDIVVKKMTREQIAKAQRLARKWMEKHSK